MQQKIYFCTDKQLLFLYLDIHADEGCSRKKNIVLNFQMPVWVYKSIGSL